MFSRRLTLQDDDFSSDTAIDLPQPGGKRHTKLASRAREEVGPCTAIEIGGRLAPPPLSHHPACLLGTGRFLAASVLQSKIDGFGFNQADFLEPTQAGRLRELPVN